VPGDRVIRNGIAAGVVALVLATSAGAAASGRFEDYTVLSWTENDGLPSSSIWALAQDRDGYIWLGTNEGVVRFDGTRFVRWNALSATPLPERRVMTLMSASDGSVWVGFGGSGGISRLRHSAVTSYDHKDGIAEDFVISLLEDRERVVWAASPSGLYRFRADRWERVGNEHGIPDGRISSTYEDRTGSLWVGTALGIYRRSPGASTFHRVDASESFASAFTADRAGAIWTTDPLVGYRRVAQLHSKDRSPIVRGNGTRVIHDRNGQLWVGTLGQGLWRVKHEATPRPAVRVITTEGGLAGNSVRSVIEDADGHIWVGADGGLSRLSPASVRAIRGLGMVRGVVMSRDSTVWAASANGVIANPGEQDERRELDGSSVSAVHEDQHGTLWAATNRGLFRREGRRFTTVRLPAQVRAEQIIALTTDRTGNLWLSDTGAGLFRWGGGKLADFADRPEIGRRTAYGLYADAQNRVWVAFSGGMLAAFDPNGTIQVFGPRSGGSLRAIKEGRDNTIWVAGDDGLSRLKDGRFVTASRKNGLPGNATSAVIETGDGLLWAGVSAGIIRLSPREFDALADNPDHQVRYTFFDRSDGLAGLPMWLGSPTAASSPDGKLWFVTGGGLAAVDSRNVQETRWKPRTLIESVVVDDQKVPIESGGSLPPLTRRLQIDYAAPSSLSPAKIRFRYRLEGYDPDWIQAGARRQVTYTGLEPRHYRFRVVANTTEGNWSDRGAVWAFSVRPAFYQTSWFPRLCVATVFGAIWVAWRLRERRIQHQFSLILAERTRVGRELHDTLLQSLVGVALQLEALANSAGSDGRPTSLREELRRMRMQVEQHVREARQSIWALRSPERQRRDLVTALRQAGEQAVAGSGVRFEFEATGEPRRCSPDREEQLLRIAREAIHNSLRHAGPATIRVRLHYDRHSVRLTVADDGRGFDFVQIGDEDGHYGLKSMQERAELAGGHLTVVSSRGKGTEVETTIPTATDVYNHAS
jgi:signal transduction histidine kinase/ligand-binding sensor domain-containing protein